METDGAPMVMAGAVLSTVKVPLVAPGAEFPAESVALLDATLIPRVPLPLALERVTV
jgi:hypothetical protein